MTVDHDIATLYAHALSVKADQLGLINAQISTLQAEAETIKEELKASGLSRIRGSLYKVTISTTERSSLSSTAMRAYLTPEQIKACTTTATVTAVTVRGL
jgi:hypothetical protein